MNFRFKNLFLLASLALLSSACDKIEQDDYLLFSGAVGEWYDGNGVNDHSQRAIIEKYTGVRCINCPTADEAISAASSQYGYKLIAVAIHDSSNFTKPIGDNPRLSTPDGNAWSNYFGIRAAGSYPNALINRTSVSGTWDLFTPTSGINSRVDNIIANNPSVAVATNASLSGNSINISVDVELLSDISGQMTVTLLIMEDGLVITQRMPDGSDNENYVHNHVLRDVITDIWGADIDCNGKNGEKRHAMFSYTDFNTDWNIDNCHIVAIVSDKVSRSILNVAQCAIE